MSESGKPVAKHWNAFPECAGLELSVPQDGGPGGVFGLNAELIFGQQPLSGAGVTFRLGVKTGFLRVALDGCAIVPGTRFAVRDQPATVQREVKREETRTDAMKAEGSAAAKLGLGSKGVTGEAELGGLASGSHANARTTSYRQEGVEEMHRVNARGTNSEPSWEISEPEKPLLDGRYLGLENLCEVAPDGSRHCITATFTCRKRDLALTEIECQGWQRPWTTKEKLALAVVASELRTTLEDLDEGAIRLCQSRLASERGPDEPDDDR